MNIWQIAKHIRHVLRARTWEGSGSNEVVFGAVHITNGSQQTAAANLRFPIALIGVADGQNDDQIPEHETRTIDVVIAVHNLGDMLGENSMIGANRTDATKSQGRGILEVEEEVKAAIREMQQALGVKISFRTTATDRTIQDEQGGMVAWESIRFEADCTDARSYPAPTDMVATPAAGQVSLTWTVPPSRYDLRRVRLIRKAGSTQPASITDGTEVALAADLSTSKVDSGLVAGTYSYTLFGCYDEVNIPPSADGRFSSVETGSYRAGVVVP